APVDRRNDDAGKLTGPVDARGLVPVLQHGHEVIARLQLQLVEAFDQRGDLAVPGRVGESHVAVDDGERLRIARHAGEETGAEVEHAASLYSLPFASRRRSAASSAAATIGT